jgi:hypothetical protein
MQHTERENRGDDTGNTGDWGNDDDLHDGGGTGVVRLDLLIQAVEADDDINTFITQNRFSVVAPLFQWSRSGAFENVFLMVPMLFC